jgi:hypothetical protein
MLRVVAEVVCFIAQGPPALCPASIALLMLVRQRSVGRGFHVTLCQGLTECRGLLLGFSVAGSNAAATASVLG